MSRVDENEDLFCDCPDEDNDGECDCEDSNGDGVCNCPEDEDGVCDCDDMNNDGECDPVCESGARIAIFRILHDIIPNQSVAYWTEGANCVGEVTLTIEGDPDFQAGSERRIHSGFHSIALKREDIPVSEKAYRGVLVKWKAPNQPWTPTDRISYEFMARGEGYKHTQYTTPRESHPTCSDTNTRKVYVTRENASANVVNCWHDADGNDVYTETTLPIRFHDEVLENGIGDSVNFGIIQVESLCLEDSEAARKGRPDDASNLNTVRDVSGGIRASCSGETVISGQTVAVSEENRFFECGDVLYATRQERAPGKKTVTDTCPGCNERHVDHYIGSEACRGIVDWGSNGWTFRLPW